MRQKTFLRVFVAACLLAAGWAVGRASAADDDPDFRQIDLPAHTNIFRNPEADLSRAAVEFCETLRFQSCDDEPCDPQCAIEEWRAYCEAAKKVAPR